jgi:hypothetical protein
MPDVLSSSGCGKEQIHSNKEHIDTYFELYI